MYSGRYRRHTMRCFPEGCHKATGLDCNRCSQVRQARIQSSLQGSPSDDDPAWSPVESLHIVAPRVGRDGRDYQNKNQRAYKNDSEGKSRNNV
jgi:hypothetical protein